jgi:hypothetical protein
MAYSMDGSARTSRSTTLELAPGSDNETVVEFVEGVVVTGVVTRDGAPAPGATVSFTGQGVACSARAHTDAGGQYSAMGLEPGLYRVRVDGVDLSYSAEHALSGPTELDIDATGAALAGSVLEAPGGEPIGGAEVTLWLAGRDTSPAYTATTSPSGVFRLRALADGAYRALASKDGYGQDVQELMLRRGDQAELRFALTPSEGLSIEVVDGRDGRPLDAVVVVRDTSRNVIANRHSGVGEDGALTIPLAPGRYLLSTSATGYGTATLPVSAPGRGLRVPLTPGGTLVVESPRELRGRLRLVRPDGEEYVRCWCNGIAGIDLEGRRTTVANVTPGTYAVEVRDASGRAIPAPASVVIQEGRSVSIVVE